MESLDNQIIPQDPDSKNYLNIAVKLGMLGGALAIIHTLVGMLTGIALRPSMTTGIISFLALLFIYIYPSRSAIIQHKNEDLAGFISFGRAFLVSLIVMVIIVLIHLSFNHIYYNFIDPDIVEEITEASVEMMEKFGAPEETIEIAIEETRKNLTSFYGWFIGVITWSIGAAILSLIVAAIMKKERPI